MDAQQPYGGIYYYMGMALEVKTVHDRLVATLPGVPEGFEILLEPAGEDRFRMQGGPLDRSTVTFTRDAAGAVDGLRSGPVALARITPDDLAALPVMEQLSAPALELSLTQRAYFEELLRSCIERADGGWIAYDLPYPKHAFVQYLTTRDLFIFHGSNNTRIETFEPVRKSMELRDETGRGNLQAVYGTHDGLWAMFFAVVDRARLKGSLRNGVMTFNDRHGERLSLYHFSINQEQLAERPYTEGALYLLPRDTFVRLKFLEASYANEWASEEPVRPTAKLLIRPDDFPFLEQIGGHDDSQLVRQSALSEAIRAAASAATLQGDRFEVTLPAQADVVARLDEYVALSKALMPAVRFEVQKTDAGVKLVISALPPAVQQLIRASYQALLRD